MKPLTFMQGQATACATPPPPQPPPPPNPQPLPFIGAHGSCRVSPKHSFAWGCECMRHLWPSCIGLLLFSCVCGRRNLQQGTGCGSAPWRVVLRHSLIEAEP